LRRQLLRDIHPRDERARRHPRFRRVVVAGGRLTHVWRHAELLQRAQQIAGADRAAVMGGPEFQKR
jgi:hypothetical protein